MVRKSFGPKQKAKASAMLLEGASPAKVAATFGVHVSTIYALRKDRGHGHSREERASHVVSFRLTSAEIVALDAFVTDGGFPTRVAAFRSLVRAATGFLELRRDEFDVLEDVRRELKAQGTNLNQLAFALNKSALRGGAKLANADRMFLSDIKRVYAALDKRVSEVFREVRQKGRAALHRAERV